MIQDAKIIPCYASDTSGVCSAMYELGGMTVVHDASGCNSTYSTFDEPRWYDMDSMIYISALSEYDAIYGNDEKLICDICDAVKELNPNFITLCGSPMPAMIGTDFDACAKEIESRTKIKTFGLHTNGMHSYLCGASEIFTEFVKHFCGERVARKDKIRVNILGATPLDFSINSTLSSMKRWVLESGFELNCTLAMGSDFGEVINAQNCDCNLVVSFCGLSVAEFMWQRYKIPYVVGVPIGKKYAEILAEKISYAVLENENVFSCANRSLGEKSKVAVVGESVFSASLACAIENDFGIGTRAICTLETDDRILADKDKILTYEVLLEDEFSSCGAVVGDRMFSPICKNTDFYSLCHHAFSGRCFSKTIPDLINKTLMFGEKL